jgi:hypothetical protein
VEALPNPNAYVTGYTESTNFRTTPGAFQTIFGDFSEQLDTTRSGSILKTAQRSQTPRCLQVAETAQTRSRVAEANIGGYH